VGVIEISGLTINSNSVTSYDFAVNINFTVTSGDPIYYMISENSDFTDAV